MAPPFTYFPKKVFDQIRGPGAAILRVDTDRTGKAIKAELLGLVPEAVGPEILKFAQGMRMRKGKDWDDDKCQAETASMVLEFVFFSQ